ncbi:hypothetical protein OE88DRAFT_1809977 [Heliocybe sulcata]|uniref:CST complex subunit STN1 n=1 Tax=Heliocybe sulcata TaxID=5364 RepID=A0A5C3MY77_9AGAM|nr:hypothetical protein OE88DRAFT_1809977 [Heliocybe sulcata]
MKDTPPTERKRRLSISKRRRVEPSKSDSSSGPHGGTVPSSTRSMHSSAEIWRWSLTRSAITTCFVRDVHEMQESGSKEHDFFWLGNFPCRTVELLGILVGVQVYEKRVIYTLDDGTSTIDCVHRPEPPPVPPSPTKPKSSLKGKEKSDPYRRPSSPKADKEEHLCLFPEPLEPVGQVGATVRVVGRVFTKYNSRQIHAGHIDVCIPRNDEMRHWAQVLVLHREKYSRSDPFVIPAPSVSDMASNEVPDTMQELPSHSDPPQTPSRRSKAIPSTPSTASSVSASSPVKSQCEEQTRSRLRHPSRLHNRDLNLNTFRIYVKHYMDNAPPVAHADNPYDCSICSVSEYCSHLKPSFSDNSRRNSFDIPTTPTKSSVLNTSRLGEETPKAFASAHGWHETTPRAPPDMKPSERSEQQKLYGFTLSYLRRVPELRLLARRTVEAEAKRRRRQERLDAKQSSSTFPASSHFVQSRCQPENVDGESRRCPTGTCSGSGEPAGRKMKRLFSVTILKLYEEGSIVLWDGSARPLPSLRYGSQSCVSQSQGLWKVSMSTASASLSVTSTTSTASIGGGDEEEADSDGDLSDVPLKEEAYVPVTPELLAGHVEAAIKSLTERASRESQAAMSTSKHASSAYRPRSTVVPGPTKEEIVKFLRRGDERWAKIGDWAIGDALGLLEKEGRAWDVGRGRWELCL